MIPFHHHRRPWTDEEREVLRTLYPYIGTAKVAQIMLRSLMSVKAEAHRLNLRKDEAFYKGPSVRITKKEKCPKLTGKS